jgi:flagellar M-ring protein FliF
LNAFMQTLRNLGPVRLGIIAGIAIITVAFMVFVIARTGSAQMSLLYTDLDPTDAGRVTVRLDALNVPYQLRNDGAQILVPADMVAKARLQLASEGLPAGGSIGYEIFDKTQGLATSSFVQNINQLRALEGELSRTVQGIQGVRQARVHLVLPQRELFSRDRQDPSASILLRMNGQLRLDKKQVQAVQHLVATAVPGLKPDRVSVVDERGTLLAGGVDDSTGVAALSGANELKVAYENRLARSVEDLLERTVGQGKARVEVAADMNTDRVSQNTEQFNPDQQVVRSTQTVNDQSEQNENDNSQSVTIANNLPAGQGTTGGGSANTSRSNRSEETTNYEISRVVRNEVREPGGVARLSVAVLVDGTYANRDGQQVYQPRTQDQLTAIDTLVKAAVGFNSQRGDQVNVVNLPFTTNEDETLQQQKLFGMDRGEVMQLAQVLALGAVAILVLLMIVRPLVRRVFESMPSAATAGDAAAMLGGDGFPQLTGPTARTMMLPGDENEEELEEMIDLNRIEGRVKASSLRKIGEIVEKHPEDVVAIIRNWLYQES